MDHIKNPISNAVFIRRPDPTNPQRNQVFIHNKDNEHSLIATVRCDGPDNIEVTTLDYSSRLRYFPHEFEVRIPRGGTRFIGFDQIGWGSLPAEYEVVGASNVSEEPTPLPNEGDILSALLLIENEHGVFGISRSHLYSFQIELHVQGTPPGAGEGFTMIPLQGRTIGAPGWKFDKWFKVQFHEFHGLG